MHPKNLPAFEQIVCYNAIGLDAALLQCSSHKGNYLLKDGRTSTETVYNQEVGIFIDENLYIPLKMSKQLFTAREAEVYFHSLGKKMPDLYQVVRFKLAVQKINASLERIGMHEFVFPEDILHNVWYEEDLKDAKVDDKRRCVIINGYKDYQKPVYQQIRNDCLLFDDTLFYRRTEECYAPISLKLDFNWSGLDFFSVYIQPWSYKFYRGSDLKLVFINKLCDIYPLDYELVAILSALSHDFGDLYQSLNGKLHKICSFDGNTSFSRLHDGEIVLSKDSRSFGAASDEETHYRKDENGLFVEVG